MPVVVALLAIATFAAPLRLFLPTSTSGTCVGRSVEYVGGGTSDFVCRTAVGLMAPERAWLLILASWAGGAVLLSLLLYARWRIKTAADERNATPSAP